MKAIWRACGLIDDALHAAQDALAAHPQVLALW
jgi:hypothetical protein